MNVTGLVPKIQSMKNVSSPNGSYKARVCMHTHSCTDTLLWHEYITSLFPFVK